MKVFCSECKWLTIHNAPDGILVLVSFYDGPATPNDTDCDHPQNIIQKTVESWYAEESRTIHKKQPSEINAHNDCEWFKKKDVRPNTGGRPSQEKGPYCGHTVPILECPCCYPISPNI